jgi:methionine-rich copper-binding protein CopC
MDKRIAVAALAACVVGFAPGTALAHAHLKKSSPAAGATVAGGPSEVRLEFDEALEPRFSKVTVEAKGGKPVPSEPASEPGKATLLIVKFAQPLEAGSYKVNWQAVSADTHKVKGSFNFQVRP